MEREAEAVKPKMKPIRFDIERAKKNIEAIKDKMYTDTDVLLLKEYHKLYKKEISIFKQSWAAAWLFMYYDQKETPKFARNDKPTPLSTPSSRGNASKGNDASINEWEDRTLEITLQENESKRLFISIGKNRRLFPREVISLIMSNSSAAREDIGAIRILDNYSFVQVRDIKADEIIEALNGITFRGRTLAVNFAKPKIGNNE
jgi:hypothetical protein